MVPRRAIESSAASTRGSCAAPGVATPAVARLEIAVADQRIAFFDLNSSPAKPAGVHHAILPGHDLLHHARRLHPGVAPHRHPRTVRRIGEPPHRA